MAADNPPRASCMITGAGGFIGQALASALVKDNSYSEIILTDVFEPPPLSVGDACKTYVKCVKADLTAAGTCQSLLGSNINCIYMLHGIMSGQAEANLELGLRVNIDSTRIMLDHLRTNNPGVKVIFTSSTAIYGPPAHLNFVFTEATAANPGSSYGAQKHICETLLNDYSRRGLLDGRVVRLPTVRYLVAYDI